MHNHSLVVQTLVEFMYGRRRPLFHVTDQRHIESIAEHGLLSEARRQADGIDPPYPGGTALTTALDADAGLSNFVFLGFSASGVMPAHEAERKQRRPILLQIDPAVLLGRGVKLALGRNSSARRKIYGIDYALRQIDPKTLEIFERILTGDNSWDDIELHDRWRINKAVNFEALVPECVLPRFIAFP